MKLFVRLMAIIAVMIAPASFAQDATNAAQPAAKYEAKSQKLNRAQIEKLLANPEQLVFIDLRRPDELTRIGGFAAYFSIQLTDLEKNLAFIPKDRVIVTVSNHAGRALRGADLLAEKGFNVAGAAGIQDYEEEGGWVTRIAPPVKKEFANLFPND